MSSSTIRLEEPALLPAPPPVAAAATCIIPSQTPKQLREPDFAQQLVQTLCQRIVLRSSVAIFVESRGQLDGAFRVAAGRVVVFIVHEAGGMAATRRTSPLLGRSSARAARAFTAAPARVGRGPVAAVQLPSALLRRVRRVGAEVEAHATLAARTSRRSGFGCAYTICMIRSRQQRAS